MTMITKNKTLTLSISDIRDKLKYVRIDLTKSPNQRAIFLSPYDSRVSIIKVHVRILFALYFFLRALYR